MEKSKTKMVIKEIDTVAKSDVNVKSQLIMALVKLTEFLSAVQTVFRTVWGLMKSKFPVVSMGVDQRTVLAALIGYLFGGYFGELSTQVKSLVKDIFIYLVSLIDRVEVDAETPKLDAKAVLHKRVGVSPPLSLVHEALTVNADIRATGGHHSSSAVRLFKKTPIGDESYDYVGMGIRVSDENLWTPMHVFDQLKDSPFKVKGHTRNVAVASFDPKMIVSSSPIDENDYVVYNLGRSVFARTGTTKAKIGSLKLDLRVIVSGCNEGTEHGTVSEGLVHSTPYNFLFGSDYSTLPGYSGSEVKQLENGSLVLKGMHLHSKTVDGTVRNVFVSTHVLNDYSKALESKTLEYTIKTSSGVTSQGEIDARERVKAVQEALEYQKKARQRGDHRYDDGVLENEWEETNAEAALRNYRANQEEFVKEFSYSNKRGWIRRGGKGKGGVKIHEAVSLKVQQREAAPLKQKSSEENFEALKTLSKITTEVALKEETAKTQKSSQPSESSAGQTQSQNQSPSDEASISQFLTQELESGRTSKSKLRKLLGGLKVVSKE